jgi:predicted transport protein
MNEEILKQVMIKLNMQVMLKTKKKYFAFEVYMKRKTNRN